MRIGRIAGGAVLVAGLVFSSAAFGEGEDVYPGTMCTKVSASTGTLYVSSESSIANTNSTNDLEVICPIVRPDAFDAFLFARVIVHDGNDAEAVECSFRCRDDLSSTFNSVTENSGIEAVGNFIVLSLDAPAEFSYGSCYIRCIVPDTDVGTSYVVNYMTVF